MTFLDILCSQLQCLSLPEISRIINFIEEEPEKVLIVADGYDEFIGGTNELHSMLLKEIHEQVLCITTSRPHAVEILKRSTSRSIEQHVKLCGFSEKQIRTYIQIFFDYHERDPIKGNKLIEHLHEQRKDLLEVARIPIRSEMICIVWAVYGSLGKTLADLYLKFILHLLDHLEKKTKSEDRLSDEQLLKKYGNILMRIATLCNTWEKYGRLRIVFNTEEVKNALGDAFENVVKIGLLSKSHPSSQLDLSQWSIPHATLQEFLVAYFLAHTRESREIISFRDKCRNIKILNRCEVIFQFLCAKYPHKANTILKMLLELEEKEAQCKSLLDFILRLRSYYSKTSMDIPLPRHLVTTNYLQDLEDIKRLFNMDKKEGHRNLRHIRIHDIDDVRNALGQPYVEDVTVVVQNPEQHVRVCHGLSHMTSLKKFHLIIFSHEEDESEFTVHWFPESYTIHSLRDGLNRKTLKILTIEGQNILLGLANTIDIFPNLETVTMVETYPDTKTEQVDKFSLAVRNCSQLKQIDVTLPHFSTSLLAMHTSAFVSVKVTFIKMGNFKQFVNALSSTSCSCNLKRLNISWNNCIQRAGNLLGQILVKIPNLQVFLIGASEVNANTIQDAVEEIKKSGCLPNLKELHAWDSKLAGAGPHLGKLISLLPCLNTLDLGDCCLRQEDLAELATAMPKTNIIKTLDLRLDELGDDISGGSKLLQKMDNLDAMRIRGNDLSDKYMDPIFALCGAVDYGGIPNLRVLDFSWTNLQKGSLTLLAHRLPAMHKLQVLGLERIDGMEDNEYISLFENIEPTVIHLNFYTKAAKVDPYRILECSQNLKCLRNLNLCLEDEDLEMLQEQLELVNPSIQVYSDSDEYNWRTYVVPVG